MVNPNPENDRKILDTIDPELVKRKRKYEEGSTPNTQNEEPELQYFTE